jgi:hypothetical protein
MSKTVLGYGPQGETPGFGQSPTAPGLVIATQTASFTPAAGATTPFVWAVTKDTQGEMQGSVYTAKTAGERIVFGTYGFGTQAAGAYVRVIAYINGVSGPAYVVGEQSSLGTAVAGDVAFSGVFSMKVGDTLTLYAIQTTSVASVGGTTLLIRAL